MNEAVSVQPVAGRFAYFWNNEAGAGPLEEWV